MSAKHKPTNPVTAQQLAAGTLGESVNESIERVKVNQIWFRVRFGKFELDIIKWRYRSHRRWWLYGLSFLGMFMLCIVWLFSRS